MNLKDNFSKKKKIIVGPWMAGKRVVQMVTTTDESIIAEPMGKSTITFIIYLHEKSCGNLLWHYLASKRQGWRRQNHWWLRCYWWQQQPTRYRCSRTFTLAIYADWYFSTWFCIQFAIASHKYIEHCKKKPLERINKSILISKWPKNKDKSGKTSKMTSVRWLVRSNSVTETERIILDKYLNWYS